VSTLVPCSSCGTHLRIGGIVCPHCGLRVGPGRTLAAVAMGLALAGCAPKNIQADYGIAETGMLVDEDGDGYTADVDCNDLDETIHPDAEESTGDDVDSNCDGDPDT